MTKISFITITARTDFPYLDRPDLHVFEPTLESFKAQTNHEFEWIVMDCLYEHRKDYFHNLELPFKVKHIPTQPNLWLKVGLPGICTQYNKGIIHADGELLFFTGDSHMVQPNFMERLWKHYKDGYFPLAWYFYDYTYGQIEGGEPAPEPYNIAGYSGKKVSHEFRYIETFKKTNRDHYRAPWEWWFGCSSASLEAMLKINGFNTAFDGDKMLLDCDVGSRLELAGYDLRFALFKDIYLIRAPTARTWNPSFNKNVTIKCNYPLIWHSRFFKKYRANEQVLTEQDIVWMKEVWCGQHCQIRELCKKEHPWQYPFEHKSAYAGHNSSKKWFNFWKKHQITINLSEERTKRADEKQ